MWLISKMHCFNCMHVFIHSQKLLRSPRKPTRKISKIPFKVLDAPELQDDFYLNLVDWSSLNVLSVGLGTCVYLWSACTSQVCIGCLCKFSGRKYPVNTWTKLCVFFFFALSAGNATMWPISGGRFSHVGGLVGESELTFITWTIRNSFLGFVVWASFSHRAILSLWVHIKALYKFGMLPLAKSSLPWRDTQQELVRIKIYQ